MNIDNNDLEEIDTNIEPEIGNEEVKSEIPFNPNDINVSIVPRTIGQLVDMLEYDEIIVPKYQRLPNLWNLKKKSRFIESLMLNLPIPLFYFSEDENKHWHVIDGLQRVSTLEHFILGGKKDKNGISNQEESFQLSQLEFRTQFNGFTWKELPRDVQRRISTNQITINLIAKGTPEQVKYNIFSRINQGATVLKPQEIRSALFQGYKMDFIRSLVSEKTEEGKMFKKATDSSIPSKRQEDLDFVTRFVSFYLLGFTDYEPDMDSFMTKGMSAIPKDQGEQENIRKGFKNAMELAFDIFDTYSFRKRKDLESSRRERINKPIFEVISTFFAKLELTQYKLVKQQKSRVLEQFTSLQHQNKFWSSITTGTASKESVITRHSEFRSMVENLIQ